MAPKASWNPLAFVPFQVSLIASAVYIALFALLLWNHHVVPASPSSPTPVDSLNLTQAWLDLAYISDGFHPIDSRRNEAVRGYILDRVGEVLEGSGVDWKSVEATVEVDGEGVVGGVKKGKGKKGKSGKEEGPKAVTVFKDDRSNVTFVDDWRQVPWTCYQESSNIMVYIRGEDDKEGDWWEEEGKYDGEWGVLMNAHYDSVSSGYGATDDGAGVVTLLQLISYFTQDGNRPKRGIVALFNNGEENGLYGAHNYLRHPLSQFTHTFLNLEGAGAGGRAVLFRSTDTEVTNFYAASPRPFGSVVFDDGFKRGLVKSGTDYSVFNGDNGMRGLDVAFFEPRSRYHTDQDDMKHTSPESVWHMISTSLATMKAMTSYSGDAFDGPVQGNGRVDIGTGSNGVWFDLFNRTFAVVKLPTLFALSVTLLVAGPVILIILQIIISRSDKWYPLTKKQHLYNSDGDDEPVHFSGMRGLLRFPIAFIAATAAVFALAYLMAKINPYIVYSSEYAVWVMMLCAYIAVAWFLLAGADRIRPTALHRLYCLVWLFALSWVILVGVTVGENNYQIASGYLMVIYNACVFVALLIAYLEHFALPTKRHYVEQMAPAGTEPSRPGSQHSRNVLNAGEGHSRGRRGDEDDEADERTSLLRGGDRRSNNTFKGIAKRQAEDDDLADEPEEQAKSNVYGDEQAWSSSLPRWTWIVQFLVLVPINIILIGQVALLSTSALHQTPADGSSPLTIYLLLALLTTILLLPLTPFLHRFAYQIPTFLFLVFAGCLIYNLLAFPFSSDARLKVFFTQTLDLNTGVNNVTLTGLDGYVQDVIDELPSSAGQRVHCGQGSTDSLRASLKSCSWHGLAPNVVPNVEAKIAPTLAPYSNHTHDKGPKTSDWLTYSITTSNASSASTAAFTLRGKNSKACRLVFSNPVSHVAIADAAHDPRYRAVAEDGSTEVRLFSREWDKTFHVNVTWGGDEKAKGQAGKVVCLWSDANVRGVIPAYDEVRRFAPVWAAGTKGSDGLVEGWKDFVVG